jgi:phosphotransferase system HPr (HPr) family protein
MSVSSEAHQFADEVADRIVILPKHLHARPAGQVAQAAARYAEAEVGLAAASRHVNARSVLAVMGLGAVTGDEVRVTAVGPGATAAVDEICEILVAPETDG